MNAPATLGFPKSARLLTRRDFQFRPFRRFQTDLFLFLYTTSGKGRLGVSISKKALRRATARNRVRRLLKETFRCNQSRLQSVDLHVIGSPALVEAWQQLKRPDVEKYFEDFLARVR